MYRPAELEALAQAAQKQEALLITTEKDWVRLPKIWQSRVAYLPVQASFDASIIKDIDKKLQRLAQKISIMSHYNQPLFRRKFTEFFLWPVQGILAFIIVGFIRLLPVSLTSFFMWQN